MCLAQGRGKRDEYMLTDIITVPDLGTDEKAYQQFYEQIKPLIIQCNGCMAADFNLMKLV